MPDQPNWRTSTYTSQDTCVEVADNTPGAIMVRDTKDPSRGVIRIPPRAWMAFLEHTVSSRAICERR
ncbi:DUF397 domain-containing protein [Streptomyces sp. NPDC005574]|uniref:DUF397 domain-containing protein n=1 Tax=Streptomyces sp. NPDC005574 TaxID=3156891 RepID=UPI0033A1A0C4